MQRLGKKFYLLFTGMALLCCMSYGIYAQTVANSCSAGFAVSSQLTNTGQNCTPISAPTGTYIEATNLNAALSSQVICDTSNTCPEGFFALHTYINVKTTGTLISAVTGYITYTDDIGTKSVPLGGSLSLLSSGASTSDIHNIYHAANTSITVYTTTTTLTGSPTYNFRSRLVWLGT